MSKTKKTVIPKWFDGEIYEMGEEVENRFTGESYYLNNIELSIYDWTIGCEMIQNWEGLRKGLDWFRTYNAKAYMVLLD